MRTLLILTATLLPISAFAGETPKPTDARKEQMQRTNVHMFKTPEAGGVTAESVRSAKPVKQPEVSLPAGVKFIDKAR
jgi:hypothetical protein